MGEWKEVYGSSHIDKVAYDEIAHNLRVMFRGGDVYVYHEVPPEVWNELQHSTSKGRYVNIVLRRGYRYDRETQADSQS